MRMMGVSYGGLGEFGTDRSRRQGTPRNWTIGIFPAVTLETANTVFYVLLIRVSLVYGILQGGGLQGSRRRQLVTQFLDCSINKRYSKVITHTGQVATFSNELIQVSGEVRY